MSQAFQAIRRQQAPEKGGILQLDKSFPALLERSKAEITRALPRHLNTDRMMRIALTAFRKNPKLAKCDPMSVLAAVVQASQMGLEIGMMGEAFLVPFKEECQLIPGYVGLMKLARQSGQVADIYAHEVHENDTFALRLGLARELIHEPLTRPGGFPAPAAARGAVMGFYAVCVFKDGTNTFVAISVEDVCRTRDESNGYKAAKTWGKDTPWDTDFEEMGKKTAIRALCKLIPKSSELSSALAMDSAADAGVSQNISLQQAADGTYQPEMVDPTSGEIADSPPKGANVAGANPATQAAPLRETAPQSGHASNTARSTAQRHANSGPAPKPAPVTAQDVTPKATPPKEAAEAVLKKWIALMHESKSEDDLNEAYIRAEAVLQGGDRDVIDREYVVIKKRLDQGTLL